MSDADLRELERRFRETGSVEDETAWLRGRVKAGDLSKDGLRLGAMLRHPAACVAVDFALPGPLEEDDGAPGWALLNHVEGNTPDDDLRFSALRRAGLALLGLALRSNPTATFQGLDFSNLLALAEACEVSAGTRTKSFESAWEEVDRADPDGEFGGASPLLVGFHEYYAWAYIDELNAARAGFEALGQRSGESLEAIRAELVPWALGYGDPVRERVEARQRGGDE